MPNGRIYVHTGLLSRLDNEAQLAVEAFFFGSHPQLGERIETTWQLLATR